jgi:hypothetical protein
MAGDHGGIGESEIRKLQERKCGQQNHERPF